MLWLVDDILFNGIINGYCQYSEVMSRAVSAAYECVFIADAKHCRITQFFRN